ncbi:hypothetical protein ACNJYG_06600 [Pseudomonas sp. GW6]
MADGYVAKHRSLARAVRYVPPGGNGYLAGDFPDGITKIEGVPGSATIRVLYRPGPGLPGDGVVVAEVESAADGTWRVDGLNPALRYDVVCRHADFNDMILANVTPAVD